MKQYRTPNNSNRTPEIKNMVQFIKNELGIRAFSKIEKLIIKHLHTYVVSS